MKNLALISAGALSVALLAGCNEAAADDDASAAAYDQFVRSMATAKTSATRVDALDLTFRPELADATTALAAVRAAYAKQQRMARDAAESSCGFVESQSGIVEVERGTLEVRRGTLEVRATTARRAVESLAAALNRARAALPGVAPSLAADFSQWLDTASTDATSKSDAVQAATDAAFAKVDGQLDDAAKVVAQALGDQRGKCSR